MGAPRHFERRRFRQVLQRSNHRRIRCRHLERRTVSRHITMKTKSKSRAAYLDDSGRPQLQDSIVAFIDILGFSHMSTSSATREDSQQLLDRIAAAIDDSRDFVRQTVPDSDGAANSRWATKFFSDNLAFGYPFDEADRAPTAWFIIRCAQRYQLKMCANGFFVRGALTQGPVCLTDEIIFGTALIDCYQLESKASIV